MSEVDIHKIIVDIFDKLPTRILEDIRFHARVIIESRDEEHINE